jgi:hypothetical protein
VRKAGEGQQRYIQITMKEVLVSSISTGGSGGEDRLTENVTLNFAEVKFSTHRRQQGRSHGSRQGLRLEHRRQRRSGVMPLRAVPRLRHRRPQRSRETAMHPQELIKEGRLADALAALQSQIRKSRRMRNTACSCSSCCP